MPGRKCYLATSFYAAEPRLGMSRGGKGAVCSLNVALITWFCPFAQLCGASCSHTSEEIVGITVYMLGGL
jgi:hypothetical protein